MVKTERFLSKREALANKYKVDVTRGGESAIYSGRAVAALAQGKRNTIIKRCMTILPREGHTHTHRLTPSLTYGARTHKTRA
jgi:hypothetical protein